MSSYNNFQNDYRKNAVQKENIFVAPKKMILEKDIADEKRRKLAHWVDFYRKNVPNFISHYFGVKLYFYQVIWLYFMSTRDSYVAICSRAVGKTWLISLLALARAVLYPSSEITVVALTKAQAGIIVEDKIKTLVADYPNIAREVKNIVTNLNKWQVDFHNGSVIKIVAARDSARGNLVCPI